MITCNLYGRMGNQLFQIAATVGHAIKHGVDFRIPENTRDNSVWKPFKPKHIGAALPNLPAYTVREISHNYHELDFKPGRINVIDGYFQSYKYFDHCFDKVKEVFGFEFKPIEKVCSVHVRRGDYLKYPHLHPVVTERYLNNAIDRIIGKTEKLIFFSDDINWCIDYALNMPFKIDYEFSKGTEREDFEKMMGCEFNIISNSTYSLWAAMLNENPKKTVISPSKKDWFGKGNAHLSTDDIIPPYFIQI